MTFIPNAKTYETVDAEYSYYAGVAFGNFQAMLADIPDIIWMRLKSVQTKCVKVNVCIVRVNCLNVYATVIRR